MTLWTRGVDTLVNLERSVNFEALIKYLQVAQTLIFILDLIYVWYIYVEPFCLFSPSYWMDFP